jgi:tRNA (guanine10-N2)-dimethyltransferase
MVNLARTPSGGTVTDPFCGTGGILIEAALLGYAAMGSDIDPRMVGGSRQNLEEMGLDAKLAQADVADFPKALGGPFDSVVTDPPYGRSTSTAGEALPAILEKLYTAASRALPPGGRLVVCLPDADSVPDEATGLSLESIHPLRVHRSLTRHITVLVHGDGA